MKKIITGLSLVLLLTGCTSGNQFQQENARTERSETWIEWSIVTWETSNSIISDTWVTHSQTSWR